MYYVYKTGIYGHGIFWIGEDFAEGKKQANAFATLDKDDYHDWELHEYDTKNTGDDLIPLYVGVRVARQED